MGKKFLCYFRLNCSRVFCQNLGGDPAAHQELGWASHTGLSEISFWWSAALYTPFSSSFIISWDWNACNSEFSLGELIRIMDKQLCIQAVQLRTV